MKITLTRDDIVTLFDKHGYQLQPGITMWGLRNAKWEPDKWNDYIGMIDDKDMLGFSGTTKPGKSPLMRPDVNENGVFILRPNFYENCWHKHLHKGKYRCLGQFGTGIFEGWRDNDKDGQFDIDAKLWRDVQGLNYHSTRKDKQVVRVGDFSEGCQVQEVFDEYEKIIANIYDSDQSLFSYALFQE